MEADGLGGRLPLLRQADLTAVARKLYDRLAERQRERASPFRVATDEGEFIGPFNACLHAPETGAAFLEMHEAEAKASPLSARLREVVILSVGAVWSSDYELYAHRAAAARAGLRHEVAEALALGETPEGLTEEETAAQRLILELMRDRQVSGETYDACEGALGRANLIAVVFLAATYAGKSTVLNAFAVPAPPAG